jgi:hypothetical protein
MTSSPYFPDDPFEGVTTFDAPAFPLAAVQMENFPLAEISRLMDGIFPEIFAALDGIGAVVCGPALALHTRIPTETADLALGVPVAAPIASAFDLGPGLRVEAVPCPAGPVAATSHLGP